MKWSEYQDAFIAYLKAEKAYSVHTLKAYSSDLSQCATFLETRSCEIIQDVGSRDLRAWILDLQEQVGNRSISRKISAVKRFYTFLERRYGLEENPTLKLVIPKFQKKLPEPIPKQDLKNLLQEEWLDDFPSRRDQLIIELLYATGMRKSELIGLRDGDVDKSRKLIKVTGKRNKQRLIPLNDYMLQMIDEYKYLRDREFPSEKAQVLLLTNVGEKMYPKFVYRVVKDYLGRVTQRVKRSPHMLRHSFATDLLDEGADLVAIKELLGHANLSATQVYTNTSLSHLKEVYNKAHPRSKDDEKNNESL